MGGNSIYSRVPEEKKALITNVGKVARRVIRNIEKLKPDFVYIFKQKNVGWNKENPEYKKVLESFEKDATIRSLIKAQKIDWPEIDSLTNYITLFDTLADLIEECQKRKFDKIYIDCTGFTKRATNVAEHLAGMVPGNIYLILNPGTVNESYSDKRDSDYVNDPGTGPEAVSFIKINTKWVSDPESNPFKVMQAAYTIVRSDKDIYKKFNKSDIIKTVAKLGMEITTVELGRACEKLVDIGFLVPPPFPTGPNDYSITLPAFAFMRRNLERSRLLEGGS